MLKVRQYSPADYPMVRAWWQGHEVTETPETILPACGLVVERDGAPAAAAWVYFDNSVPLAWLAWVVSRPGQKPIETAKTLAYLVGAAEEAARAQGRKIMVTMCRSRSLARWLSRQGFTFNHGGVFDLIKPLA